MGPAKDRCGAEPVSTFSRDGHSTAASAVTRAFCGAKETHGAAHAQLTLIPVTLRDQSRCGSALVVAVPSRGLVAVAPA